MFIVNIELSHPKTLDQIKLSLISVAGSFIPENECAVEQIIEETFMNHSKLRGGSGRSHGISGISQNHSAYPFWLRSIHNITIYLESTYSMDGLISNDSEKVHKDLCKSMIEKSQKICFTNKRCSIRIFESLPCLRRK